MVAHGPTAGEILGTTALRRSPCIGEPVPDASVGDVATEWQLDDPHALPAVGELFAGVPLGAQTFGWTSGVVAGLGPAVVRLSPTQVAFRHRIGFAWIWPPGMWLAHPKSGVALSVGLRHEIDSPRWKQVVEPYPGRWMHHLEVSDPDALDDEVAGWVAAAYEAAA
jgi:hypothetical protein